MKIIIIPETEEEQERMGEESVEISNINEFLIFGNNVTEDGKYNDFHEWTGSYRYLLGSLQYYANIVNDERQEASTRKSFNSPVPPTLRIVEAETDDIVDDERDDED